jgi:hypothetical protein
MAASSLVPMETGSYRPDPLKGKFRSTIVDDKPVTNAEPAFLGTSTQTSGSGQRLEARTEPAPPKVDGEQDYTPPFASVARPLLNGALPTQQYNALLRKPLLQRLKRYIESAASVSDMNVKRADISAARSLFSGLWELIDARDEGVGQVLSLVDLSLRKKAADLSPSQLRALERAVTSILQKRFDARSRREVRLDLIRTGALVKPEFSDDQAQAVDEGGEDTGSTEN